MLVARRRGVADAETPTPDLRARGQRLLSLGVGGAGARTTGLRRGRRRVSRWSTGDAAIRRSPRRTTRAARCSALIDLATSKLHTGVRGHARGRDDCQEATARTRTRSRAASASRARSVQKGDPVSLDEAEKHLQIARDRALERGLDRLYMAALVGQAGVHDPEGPDPGARSTAAWRSPMSLFLNRILPSTSPRLPDVPASTSRRGSGLGVPHICRGPRRRFGSRSATRPRT